MKKANGVYPNKLDEYIRSQGYQKQEIAQAVGVSRNMLTHYLKGRYSVQPHVRKRFAEVLGVPITELFPMTLLLPSNPSPSTIDIPASVPSPQQVAQQPPVTYNSAVFSSSLPELDKLDIMRSRRQVLETVLSTACTALTLSPYAFLHTEGLERLQKALANPARVDKDTLNDLSSITGSYWKLRSSAHFIDLLNGVSGHFTTVVYLLRESHSTPIYLQLCSLAAENAQLIGEVLYEIREYDLAWAYYTFSVKQAREAKNDELQAVGLGRMALLLISREQSENAFLLVREAFHINRQNARIRSWLAAIEAEIHTMHVEKYANQGNAEEAYKSRVNYIYALDIAKDILHGSTLETDVYVTGFDSSRLFGYEGACLLRVRQPEQALPILQNALHTTLSTTIRRRATLSADIGKAYALLGDIKNACIFAHQALQIATEVKSLTALQRIYTLREELTPWKDNIEVKDLNKQFMIAIASLRGIKNML